MKNVLTKFFQHKLIKFALVAGVSAGVELILFTILLELRIGGVLLITFLAQVISMIINFLLNKFLTFKTANNSALFEIVKYLLIWGANVVITTFLMSILTQTVNIYPTILRAGVIVIMFFLNFLAAKLFIYRS